MSITVDHQEFKTIACILVSHLTPKMAKYRDTAIEFAISINGEELLLRAFAPSNYRQIWAKLPESGWIELANHDTGWREGLEVYKYTDDGRLPVELREIRHGKLPKTKELEPGFCTVDTEKGEHLAPLASSVDLSDIQSRYDLYTLILYWVYQDDDYLEAVFKKPGGSRTIRVLDVSTLERIPQTRLARKQAPFDGNGLAKLLGKGEWRLSSLYHRRTGYYFT